MKIHVERELLEKKLQSLAGVLSGKSIIPILDEAHIEVSEDEDGFRMFITASDEKVTTSTRILCDVEAEGDEEEPFNFVCDMMTILSTISLLKSGHVTLTVTKGKSVVLSTPKTRKRYEVPIQYGAGDFPTISADKWTQAVTVSGQMLSRMIKKAAIFVNPNDIRPALGGIHIYSKDGIFCVESTNAQIFCRTTIDSNIAETKLPDMPAVIVPRSITKISPNYENSHNVQISIDEDRRNLRMYDGVSTTFVRLIDSTFPDVQQFYDQYNQDTYIKVDKESMLLAIRRIAIFTHKVSKTIVFDMNGDNIIIKGVNVDFNKSADELVEVEKKDILMTFTSGFNHSFISAALQNLAGENLYFTQASYKEPGYFTDDSSEGFDTLWLVAPIVIEQV